VSNEVEKKIPLADAISGSDLEVWLPQSRLERHPTSMISIDTLLVLDYGHFCMDVLYSLSISAIHISW
jgi:hypothetical protein